MRNPKISIIVPVYKSEAYIHRCLDSIIKQSYQDWECILVDDGSPDKSGAICDEFMQMDSRIVSIHHANGGPSKARNTGIEKSTGEYIWFVDSDDFIEDGSIEKLLSEEGISDCDVCFFPLLSFPTNYKPFDYDGILASQSLKRFYGKKQCGEAIAKLELSLGFGWTCNKIFKGDIVRDNNLRFDLRFSIQEDHLFTLEYMKFVDSISVISYMPYRYYMQEGSLLNRSQPFNSTKERDALMLERRRDITSIFSICDCDYIKWYSLDYINREIRNLRCMKQSLFGFRQRVNEIKRCKMLARDSKDLNNLVKHFRLLSLLPSFLIDFIIKYR